MSRRKKSKIELLDYSEFVRQMDRVFPDLDLTDEIITEIWNFGNDCWSDGYGTGKHGWED